MQNHIEKCILVYKCKFRLLLITQSIKPITSVGFSPDYILENAKHELPHLLKTAITVPAIV